MCAEVRELAPELALGIVGGPERAEALQHASECGPCRALVGDLAEAADALPLLAAEAEPPAGFEERVLSALKAPRRRNRRRSAALVAVAAAAATIVSIVSVRVVESVQETNRIATAASDVRSAHMNGANGVEVGNVFVANGTPSSVVVNVNYWVPPGNYGIEFRTGSTDKRLGDVSIHDDGRGSWGGVAALPGGAAGSIVLVGADGAVVCEARLPPIS
jgi:archaellum component FlaF (FlaF/FlaG flagellin family)